MAIDDRKQRVLRAIVALYGTEGEPVGSGLLAQHFEMAVSSATLRNEMAALTRLGLLEQPHTSAGRVPSTEGYRYYIDHLLDNVPRLSLGERQEIETLFKDLDYDPLQLVREAAKLLAQRTGLAVIATTPKSNYASVAHYELIQVGRMTVAVLAVTNEGSVKTRVAKVDKLLNAQELLALSKVINASLTLRTADDVTAQQVAAIALASGKNGAQLLPIAYAAYRLLCETGLARVYFEGQQNLLKYTNLYPSLQNLLSLVENQQDTYELLNIQANRTAVLLGEDVPNYNMSGISFITKQYLAGGGRKGALAIVGPTRMPYMNIIPQLEYFALMLGQTMTGMAQEDDE